MRPRAIDDIFVPLGTRRLTLVPVLPQHAEPMFSLLGDERLYDYVPGGPPQSASWLRERYSRLASGTSPDGSQYWLNWIVMRVGLDCAGDSVGYVQATVENTLTTAQLAWVIGVRHQRRGFAREAVVAVCEHLFAVGVEELRAIIDTRNVASIALAESLQFRRIGTVPSDDVLDGGRGLDHIYRRAAAQ